MQDSPISNPGRKNRQELFDKVRCFSRISRKGMLSALRETAYSPFFFFPPRVYFSGLYNQVVKFLFQRICFVN